MRPSTGDPTVGRTLHTTAVVTPEAVLLEFRAAGVGSRVLAKGLDLLIQLAAFYALIIVAAVTVGFGGTASAVIVLVVGVFVVFFGYPTIEAVWSGQTVGKRAFGLRVITVEGGPVTFRHAAIRSLIWIVEFLIPPGGLTALTSALLTRRSQRIGDLAAGTVVIRRHPATPSPVFFPPAFGAERFGQLFDASLLGPRQYALVREFLTRANDLTPAARHHLATGLAAAVESSSGVARPVELDPERYLVSAVFAAQQRGSDGVVIHAPPPSPVAAAPPPPPPPPAPIGGR